MWATWCCPQTSYKHCPHHHGPFQNCGRGGFEKGVKDEHHFKNRVNHVTVVCLWNEQKPQHFHTLATWRIKLYNQPANLCSYSYKMLVVHTYVTVIYISRQQHNLRNCFQIKTNIHTKKLFDIMRPCEWRKLLLVSWFMSDGECQTQACVFINGTAPVFAAHPTNWSKTCNIDDMIL